MALETALRRWAIAGADQRTLCIDCEGEGLASRPWESLPRVLGLERLTIARLSGSGARWPAARLRARGASMVVAGWSRHRGRNLAGIARELVDMAALSDARLATVAVPDASPARLREACAELAPFVVHLAHPGVERPDEDPGLSVPGEDGAPHRLSSGALGGLLAGPHLRLVVLNAAHGGLSMARALSQDLNAISVGWTGGVSDDLAADFSLFFYQRLLEGSRVTAAIHAFLHRSGSVREARGGAALVVWLPFPEAAGWSLVEHAGAEERSLADGAMRGEDGGVMRGEDGGAMRGEARGLTREELSLANQRLGGATRGDVRSPYADVRSPFRLPHGDARSSPGAVLPAPQGASKVKIAFTPLAALNPALLRNGGVFIERLSVESSEALEGARLQLECDTGLGRSTFRETLDLAKGLQPIPTEEIQFPALHQLIAVRAERRVVNFTVSVHGREGLLAETTRSVLWMGPSEWMDRPETWPFLSAFVQPKSKGVLRVFERAVEVLRTMGSPRDTFSGYQGGDEASVKRQMRALFVTLRDSPFGLRYFNPPGSPVYVPGARGSSGQHVRLPDEVIEHRQGTCHDLALLFASCAEHIGLYPLLILMPGHTFFGFWTGAAPHQRFWRAARGDLSRSSRLGGEWVIDDLGYLEMLAQDGAIELVEATFVTNEQSTYEEACAEGLRKLGALRSLGLDAAVDVWASRRFVQPL